MTTKCPACDWEASPGARFCAACGAGLFAKCPDCGQEGPLGARFCTACGAALSPAKAATPPPRSEIAERRLVTVMFCDLADSTLLSTRLDLEDYHELIGAYQSAASAEIERFGGFVAKYMGDGILAYFGYPQAAEDDAERAVRCGLSVSRIIAARVSQAGPQSARIGIATGSVIIGDLIGEGSAREQAIAGETPNLAARLQGLAVGGGVVIGASTHALVGRLFQYQPLGEVALKGFARPQPAYRVVGLDETVGRFEALRVARSSLVGREEEIEILRRRWERAKAGEPQIVLISADPGIGKSRLVADFRAQVGTHPFFAHYCAPHAVDSAFHPLARALEVVCRFAAADTPSAKLVKMEAALRDPSPLSPQQASLIASVLALPIEGYPAFDLSPHRYKEEAIRALTAVAPQMRAKHPTIALYEDLHWIDPSSLEVVKRTLKSQPDEAPTLTILTYRPEFSPPTDWLDQPNVSILHLARLRRGDAEAMVQRVAAGVALTPQVVRHILEHAEGVPLFIEEITRAVAEGGDAGDEMTVPATLQASLLARLDRLKGAKDIAQTAAAIGREFSYRLLASVAQLPAAALEAGLEQLIDADLIFARGSGPEAAYVFKHALIQDIAYAALLRAPRQALHDRIATVLLESFDDEIAAWPETLARHLSVAGRDSEAVVAWRKAAVKTLAAGSWQEGLSQLGRAMMSVAALPEGRGRDRLELDLQMMIGGVAQGAHGHSAPAAQAAYDRAYALARKLGEPRLAALAGGRTWIDAYGAGDLEGVMTRLERVRAELAPFADPLDEILVRESECTSLCFMGRFAETTQLAERIRPVLENQREPFALEEYYYMTPLVPCYSSLMLGYFCRGAIDASAEVAAAMEAGMPSMDPMGVVICLTVMIYRDILAEAWADLARHARGLEEAISEIEGATHFLDLVGLANLLPAARAHEIEASAIAEAMARPSVAFAMQHLPRYLMIAGDALAALGARDGARANYTEALTGGPFGSQQWLRAELLRRLGDVAEDAQSGEALYHQALEAAAGQGATLFELRAAMSLARLWRGQGRGVDATAMLSAVCTRLHEEGPDLAAARVMLAEDVPHVRASSTAAITT